jgi:cellulose biosynthesis protein BcsQ
MLTDMDVKQLTDRLVSEFPGPARVNVTADQFRGARIMIISDQFTDHSPAKRREIILNIVSDDEIAHLELLTSDEALFYGVSESTPSHASVALPLWPDSLLGGQAESFVVHLPSQKFEPLPPPVVATFYSLRGGVGRSTALAHTARILASQGLRVLCIDMDLEAPGLASLFGVEDQVVDGKGVVPLLLQTEIGGDLPALDEHIISIAENLDLLPAGVPNANYARQLSLLDPSAWYREEINPLRLLIDGIAERTPCPDFVLIDSRTGISPLAAPLLFDVADLAIVAFYPHPQARAGTEALTRALLASRSRRSTVERPISPEIRFMVSPVPTAPAVRERYEGIAQTWIEGWLEPARDEAGNPAFDSVEDVTQVVAYQEGIATSDSTLAIAPPQDYEALAAWIAGILEPRDSELQFTHGNPAEPTKSEVLAALKFGSETAEQQDQAQLITTMITTDAVIKARKPGVPLVIGRKGTGKTALFRRLAAEEGNFAITSPSGTESHRPWMPDSNLYGTVSIEIEELNILWRQAWPVMIGLAIAQQLPDVDRPDWVDELIGQSSKSTYRGSEFLRDLRLLLNFPDAPLRTTEWLEDIDRSLDSQRILLFDGLDTGFGNTDTDRNRRTESVSGLLTVVNELAPGWRNLRPKIFLREDIWRDATFPNKSHLSAQSARISWSNQVDYLRIALKRAWNSEPFKRLVSNRLNREDFELDQTPIEYWPDSFVKQMWIILAGERMAGGRTAYTENWVWTRLGDSNADHTPRALLHLLAEATQREIKFEEGNPYAKSILRPRALVESLDGVSENSLDALRGDEFPELAELLGELTQVGKTPFEARVLSSSPDVLNLAREVGLLEPIGGVSGHPERYRVPELYRKALNMGRSGPQ